MAQKEVAIKITIEGQEVVLAGKQLEVFKKNVEDLKNELEKLGARTEANADVWDKLKGDIDALENSFVELTDDIDNTNEAIEESTELVGGYGGEIGRLEEQLASLGGRTKENAKDYDALASNISDLRTKQEDLQFSTQTLDQSLSNLPGPIGEAGRGFQSLNSIFKSAKASLTLLTKQFPILQSAIAATGIGALVIILGLLVAAVIKAFNSFEPLQKAVGELGVLFELLGDITKPLIELIGEGLVVVMNALGTAIAWVTGNLDEYNEAIAEREATDQAIQNTNDRIEALEREGILAEEKRKEDIDLEVEYLKKKSELDQKYYDEKKVKDDDYYRDAELIEKEYNKKVGELGVKRLDEQKRLDDDRIKQERDTQIKLLQQQVEFNKTTIDITDELFQARVDLQDEQNEESLNRQKRLDDFLLEQAKITSLAQLEIDKEAAIATAEIEGRKTDTIVSEYDERIKRTGELYDVQQELADKHYNEDLVKIREEAAQAELDIMYQNLAIEQEIRDLGLNDRFRQNELAFQDEVKRVEERNIILQEQAKEAGVAEQARLQEEYNNKIISLEQFQVLSAELIQEYQTNVLEIQLQTEEDILAAKQANIQASYMLAGSIGELATAMGEESAAGKALIKVQQALTLTTTILALVQAFAGLGKDLSKGFPTNIIAVASTLALIAAAVVGFKQLTGIGIKDASKGNVSSSSSSSSAQGNNYGRNYEDGGMIGGARHAQGGTLIEAEDGEAIMTRGAVTLFQPLLSAMNQLGGGTSFAPIGGGTYDAPVLSQPEQQQNQPMYIKTYVVENDLTTEQEKQARLKDLSTI